MDCLDMRKSHTCTWKRTSWGDYQCELCYQSRHVLEQCDVCKEFIK